MDKKNQLSPPQDQIDSVIALYSNGQIEEALDSVGALIKDYPNEALLYNVSGACYAVLEQLDTAVKRYEKALAIKPDYAEAHNNLGGTLQELGQLEAALQCYEKALALKTDYAEAHFNLGNVLKELGQLDIALKSYKKALTIKPDYAEAHFSLGITLQNLGQLDDAVKSYEEILSIKPDFAEAYNNLGITHKELGQLDAAVKCYKSALVIKPDFADAHYNLGGVLQKLGQLDASVKSFEEALAIKPEFTEAHNNLGNTFMELGQLDAAIKCYEKAISIKPDYAEAYSNFGGVLNKLGKISEAVKCYEKALTIKPDYADAHHLLNGLIGHTSKSPPKRYVEKLFDDYADRFDDSLVEGLQYRLPFLMKELILKLNPTKNKFKKVIDLGCGTGLSGHGLRDISENLTGIDLSNNMISKAKERQIYDHLIVGDIVDTLNSSTEKYDLFIALDVLIYIGEVTAIINTVRKCSNKNAYFILSIESQVDGEYSLLKTGRYSHSENYILNSASDMFKLIRSEEVNLRKEEENWIDGKIFIFQAS